MSLFLYLVDLQFKTKTKKRVAFGHPTFCSHPVKQLFR
ncbi:uncharacterized protein MP3633_3004 [Marinomonas primoryensis]|uniref:Uncharacterized protein n=1 Tax=Marinomonas primoryensis TaxID=178399 RepID=A0A859D452_9GAMM|nr:uncharacterized protein MP3633_3004 [Marinomonas primoryensis]